MNPLEEYLRRQAKWTAEQQLAQRAFVTIGNWRLFIAVVAAILAWFAFGRAALSGWWLLAPLVLFIALAAWHQRVLARRACAERGIRYYHQRIQRVQDTWSGRGSLGEEFLDPNHVYADDLDVFGKGSLFELISSARTAAGERTLAQWLLAPATRSEAKERQEAVRELAAKLDLREDIALLGEDIKSSVTAELLRKWGAAPVVKFPSRLRIAALVLSVIGLATVILKLAEIWPLWPILAVLVVNVTIIFFLRKQTAQVDEAIESAAHQLSLFSLLIERLEHEHFTSAGLSRLRLALMTEGLRASKRIKHLDRWLEVLDSSDHVILRVLGPLLLYKQQIVMAIEAWRSENGTAIGRWIQALAEFEALSSLGALHYERPAWNFPTLEQSSSAHFVANDIGHPLLAASVAVRNSLSLDAECRLLIVSGSNMSGKSTLLRAVGLNAILAWAGAPVCAEALSLSRIQVGASIRVSDSLQDNRSRFFAEISRLRQIVELTKGSTPVLFLLDELLSGTNSHDRRIGAAGIVRGLLAANTVGLLTTHDLALAKLDHDSGVNATNVHFEDRITDGKIEFDYHLRPGVVTHSNALELMRSIGLEI
jgi:hypothetical protein